MSLNHQHLLQSWQQRVLEACDKGQVLNIRGGASKAWYGQACVGEEFITSALSGIIAYEPTELVMTAYCGTPLAEIEAALLEQNQMLAFEPPHFSPHATVGGMFASSLAGPRRVQAGALREFTLGASLLDGRGQILHFGGQVMKNVAGYDVSRLLAGSMGTLGVVLQVSLKVLPKPMQEHSLRLEMRAQEALNNLQRWRNLPISASVWEAGQLTLRLSGSEAAVQAARKQLGGASLAHASSFWRSLREQELAFFEQNPHSELWRLSLPPSTPHASQLGEQIIEWHGAQRWLRIASSNNAQQAMNLRAFASQVGGHATLFRAAATSEIARFTPVAPAIAKIERNLRQTFDPAGIFNTGRMGIV